jgi:hypothetical protein
LPKHINEENILNEISIEKDVDGFHPLNIGKLAMKGRDPLFLPCTPKVLQHLSTTFLNTSLSAFFVFLTSWPLYLPFFCSLLKGCMELLSRSGVTVKGKNAVVVGRSNIVGLPVSLLLLKADATVSIVHSRTPNPEVIVRQADIVIAAAGQAMMVCCSAGSNSLDSTGVSPAVHCPKSKIVVFFWVFRSRETGSNQVLRSSMLGQIPSTTQPGNPGTDLSATWILRRRARLQVT